MHDGAGVGRSVGGRDGGLDGFDEHVEVDVVMSGNGNDGGVFSDGALEEGFDFAMGIHGSFLGDKVDFVLDDHDVFNASDFQRHQVLTGLRLRARFVGGHHQHGPVHDGGARDHDGHQRLVARRVNERDDSLEL